MPDAYSAAPSAPRTHTQATWGTRRALHLPFGTSHRVGANRAVHRPSAPSPAYQATWCQRPTRQPLPGRNMATGVSYAHSTAPSAPPTGSARGRRRVIRALHHPFGTPRPGPSRSVGARSALHRPMAPITRRTKSRWRAGWRCQGSRRRRGPRALPEPVAPRPDRRQSFTARLSDHCTASQSLSSGRLLHHRPSGSSACGVAARRPGRSARPGGDERRSAGPRSAPARRGWRFRVR